MKTKVTVAENSEHPVEKNVLANAIVEISSAMKRLERGGLNLEAVIVLTHHNCKSPYKFGKKPGMGEIRAVFESLSELEKHYTKIA